MKNNQKYTFERNRYYSGKLLTSADFRTEQEYGNDKRRLINHVMFGSGIVWGMGVYSLDDLSLMIESGVALDSMGREIVIPEAEILKLSSIEGFDETESGSACLYVRYAEEETNPMYAVRQGEEQMEYNKICEKYDFVLTDERNVKEPYGIDTEFLTEAVLFEDNNYTLKINTPAVVCKGQYVKICLVLNKKTDANETFRFKGTLQLPNFFTEEGGHECVLNIEDRNMKEGESVTEELWVLAENSEEERVKIILEPRSTEIFVGEIRRRAEENLVLDITLTDTSVGSLVDAVIGKTNLEMRTMASESEGVCLAKIYFQRTEQGYMIDRIEEREVKKYIETPADNVLRNQYLNYFAAFPSKHGNIEKTESVTTDGVGLLEEQYFISGSFEIPLGKGAKRGEIFYSGEIACGMEKTAYIQLGFDVQDVTVFGDADIFKGQNKRSELPPVETAVKLYRNRGTFQAGVKFLKDYDSMLLKCRFVAMKEKDGAQTSKAGAGKNKRDGYIAMDKSTVVMKPGESIYLPVRFVDMEECAVTYALNGEGSGEITDDGIYTAPREEGVYEINVFCADRPTINTFCFAVVRKEEQELAV